MLVSVDLACCFQQAMPLVGHFCICVYCRVVLQKWKNFPLKWET